MKAEKSPQPDRPASDRPASDRPASGRPRSTKGARRPDAGDASPSAIPIRASVGSSSERASSDGTLAGSGSARGASTAGRAPMRHLISLFDISADDVEHIFGIAESLKEGLSRGVREPLLQGRVLTLIFEKPSLRTR